MVKKKILSVFVMVALGKKVIEGNTNTSVSKEKFYSTPFVHFFTAPELNQAPMSISVTDCDVQDAIKLVGHTCHINFLIDSEVKGTIGACVLHNCMPGHVLQVICMSNKPELALVKELEVWRIRILETALKEYNMHNQDNYVYMDLKIRKIKFDEDIRKTIEAVFKRMCNENNAAQAYLIIDGPSRNLFIYAPEQVLQIFKEYITGIDTSIPQVRIEAVIVIADKRCEFNWGIDWSGMYNRLETIRLKKQNFSFVGIGGTLKDFANSIQKVCPLPFAFNLVTRGKQFINVPIVFGGPDLNTRRLNLLLQAAEADAKLKIVSRPSVLTYNNETAEILIGNDIPIQTVIEDVFEGKVRSIDTVQYRDVGTKILVTPSVNMHDNSIVLDILVEDSHVVDFEDFVHSKERLKVPPVIKTIRTKNKVMLRDGSTTVIGGLTFNKEDIGSNRVPLLSRLPLIGWIFESYHRAKSDTEQIIFITPTLVAC